MSTAEFTISFDGEALKDHRIDVRDLAPALLAIGSLFEEANRTLNGEQVETKVQVRATPPGSFEVVLHVVQTLAKQLEGFLIGHQVEAAKNLQGLLFGSGGLVTLLLLLRGRKPKQIASDANGVTLQIENQTIVVAHQVVQLAESVPVRTEIEKVLTPLRREGIDKFEAKERPGAIPTATITKSDLLFFALPEGDEVVEPLPERSWTQAYSIVSLTFKEENKWRLSDGQSAFGVTILDPEFLARVDAGLSFSKGDVLVCEMRSRQQHTADGVRTEYFVDRVVQHRPAPKQFKLIRDDS
jgi:hypothetical protein